LRLASDRHGSKRELECQIDGGLCERAVLHPPKVSAARTQLRPDAPGIFKDIYLLHFLNLPESSFANQSLRLLFAIVIS